MPSPPFLLWPIDTGRESFACRCTYVAVDDRFPVNTKPCNVLFLCTGNSARSIMAESILRKKGEGRFIAWSAGSQPKAEVHPLAIQTLAELGYPTDGLRSKSWDEFTVAGAPTMDFIFTVCDNAAGEACPVWPGHPMTAHWGIADPAALEGTDLAQLAAFRQTLQYLESRISLLLSLPIQNFDRQTLESEVAAIGREPGASRTAPDPD